MQDFEPIMPLRGNASLSDDLMPLLTHIAAVIQFFPAIQIGTQCVPN